MPYVRRKTYAELLAFRDDALNLQADVVILATENAVLEKVITARNGELDAVGGFLRFLAVTVPDYEGYVLDYMDQEEFNDDPAE